MAEHDSVEVLRVVTETGSAGPAGDGKAFSWLLESLQRNDK